MYTYIYTHTYVHVYIYICILELHVLTCFFTQLSSIWTLVIFIISRCWCLTSHRCCYPLSFWRKQNPRVSEFSSWHTPSTPRRSGSCYKKPIDPRVEQQLLSCEKMCRNLVMASSVAGCFFLNFRKPNQPLIVDVGSPLLQVIFQSENLPGCLKILVKDVMQQF